MITIPLIEISKLIKLIAPNNDRQWKLYFNQFAERRVYMNQLEYFDLFIKPLSRFIWSQAQGLIRVSVDKPFEQNREKTNLNLISVSNSFLISIRWVFNELQNTHIKVK